MIPFTLPMILTGSGTGAAWSGSLRCRSCDCSTLACVATGTTVQHELLLATPDPAVPADPPAGNSVWSVVAQIPADTVGALRLLGSSCFVDWSLVSGRT